MSKEVVLGPEVLPQGESFDPRSGHEQFEYHCDRRNVLQ